VPTTGGLMKARTAECLVNLVKVLAKNGIEADLRNINNSDIVTVRNLYANMLLESDRWDSLLFIDSDMAFHPRVITKLIAFNAPVSAAACTKRHIDLAKFGAAMRDHGDIERARAESVFFNTLLTWDNRKGGKFLRKGGFATFAAVGMAVCLIKKEALQLMVDEGAVDKRQDVYEGVTKTSWNFFDFILYAGVTLTEDYSFCHRWNFRMKQPLWVCIDEIVDHIGDFNFSGRYTIVFDRLMAERAKPLPAPADAPPE
jgi:cellulose synthase/poly-beta-1,6-N-acetylglucosamine synthase-like glycosyltransferase